VGAAETRARTEAVDLAPTPDGKHAHPGGEPDAQCSPPASSQSSEGERFSGEEHRLAAGRELIQAGEDAVGTGYGDTRAPGKADGADDAGVGTDES